MLWGIYENMDIKDSPKIYIVIAQIIKDSPKIYSVIAQTETWVKLHIFFFRYI